MNDNPDNPNPNDGWSGDDRSMSPNESSFPESGPSDSSQGQQSYAQYGAYPRQETVYGERPAYPQSGYPQYQYQQQQSDYQQNQYQQPYGSPYRQSYAPGQQFPPQGQYYPVPPAERWNVLCIVGFILSFIIAPVGLVLSIIALVQINSTREKSKGLSIAGIVIGALGTLAIVASIVLVVWLVGEVADHTYFSADECSYSLNGKCYDYDDWEDYLEDYYGQYGQVPNDDDFGFDLGDDLYQFSSDYDSAYVVRDTPIA